MSPIPGKESICPEMFIGLQGHDFIDSLEMVNRLAKDTEAMVTEPPQGIVTITDSILSPSNILDFNISKAMLIRGSERLGHDIAHIEDKLLPHVYERLDKDDQFSKIFSIGLEFNRDKQIITAKKDGVSIRFKHNGLANPISGNARYSIIALGLSNNELLKDISKNGIVFGFLKKSLYRTPWIAEIISISLPDEFTDSREETVLEDKGIQYLSNISKSAVPHYKDYLKSLKPVGIFIDLRE